MAGGVFGGGNGTEHNPYLVEDAEDLDAVRNHLEGHFLQVADIDLSAYDSWQKIGNVAEAERFSGVYDGDNYEISSLRIRDLTPNPRAGLFCWIAGEVRNVHLRNVDIDCSIERSQPRYVVALDLWPIAFVGTFRLGFPTEGGPDLTDPIPLDASNEDIRLAIEDLASITGSVSVSSTTEGILSQKRWIIQYSAADGPGNMYVVYHITEGIGDPSMTISTQTWTENPEDPMRFAGVRVGGLAGDCTGLVENCSVVGGTVKGSYFVGGLLATLSGTAKKCFTDVTTIANYVVTSWQYSSWSGWSIWNRTGVNVGGLTGIASAGCTIENCYARGAVISTFNTHILGHLMRNVAGFAGQANPNASLLNCYSICGVTSVRAQARGFAGNDLDRESTPPGTAEEPHPGIVNCYFDKETSGREDDDGWGLPRTTDQMTHPHEPATTYVDWAFNLIWYIRPDANDGYPMFDPVALVELGGGIDATSYWFTRRLMQMWAKRNGVYEPVEGYVKHNGVYQPIKAVYHKVNGEYKE